MKKSNVIRQLDTVTSVLALLDNHYFMHIDPDSIQWKVDLPGIDAASIHDRDIYDAVMALCDDKNSSYRFACIRRDNHVAPYSWVVVNVDNRYIAEIETHEYCMTHDDPRRGKKYRACARMTMADECLLIVGDVLQVFGPDGAEHTAVVVARFDRLGVTVVDKRVWIGTEDADSVQCSLNSAMSYKHFRKIGTMRFTVSLQK